MINTETHKSFLSEPSQRPMGRHPERAVLQAERRIFPKITVVPGLLIASEARNPFSLSPRSPRSPPPNYTGPAYARRSPPPAAPHCHRLAAFALFRAWHHAAS